MRDSPTRLDSRLVPWATNGERISWAAWRSGGSGVAPPWRDPSPARVGFYPASWHL